MNNATPTCKADDNTYIDAIVPDTVFSGDGIYLIDSQGNINGNDFSNVIENIYG